MNETPGLVASEMRDHKSSLFLQPTAPGTAAAAVVCVFVSVCVPRPPASLCSVWVCVCAVCVQAQLRASEAFSVWWGRDC